MIQVTYTIQPNTRKFIERAFVHHPPHSDQPARYERIRGCAKVLAEVLATSCPPSTELDLALLGLSQVCMLANASIARHEPDPGPQEASS